jgi:zinc transport system permease protein
VIDALALPFFQRVLLAGLLASFACGVIGTYVVAKRIASLSGGLAHAAFGGVGLGYLAGFAPMLGALGFGVGSALAIGLASRRLGSGLDTLIAMVWAVGMALGVLFVGLVPGYAPDLTSYLFGSLLFVSWTYVWAVAALDLLIATVVWLFFKELQAVAFDEDWSALAGLRVEPVFLGLLTLAALAILTLIRVVGVILAIALLTIPAASARPWANGLARMMGIATALCGLAIVSGLLLSYSLSDVYGLSAPPGPLIVLVSAAFYVGSSAMRRLLPPRRG